MMRALGVEKCFGGTKVRGGVDLEVKPGTVAVLIGPSGGGKSTLLRCLVGLDSFDAGLVEACDQRFTAGMTEVERAQVTHRLRGRVGMVFQQFHLFRNMNVIDNVT